MNAHTRKARTTIAVQGARVHNLKNISVEIPRDSLTVVTGLSGSGKSSLAFDTIYAEGQRRYMESLSSFAKRFIAHVAKPDVDFVFGLSPVISIEQKTLTSNPRSTVGTMTDIASYLNLLYATIGHAHCPRTGEPTPSKSAGQILEAILSLPEGTEIELRAPVFKVYGEELDFVLTDLRKKGCRRLIADGRLIDLSTGTPVDVDSVEHMHKVVSIDQSPIGRNIRSNPATYVGFYDAIRDLFTQAPLAIERDYRPGRFSFNVKGGRCEECQGEGVITTQLYFMPDVEVTCGACKGARFNNETLEVTLRGKTIDDVLNMSVEEGVSFFASEPTIGRKIQVLADLGLGYLTLGQSATTLSGGEAQRIKIATELSTLQRSKHTVYILDEPTTGLHLADIERLLASLTRLVDAGHTVILIEHHLDVIKVADHVIDLGPEGGHAGGEVVVTGTPEDVAACNASHTGRFLKARLRQLAAR